MEDRSIKKKYKKIVPISGTLNLKIKNPNGSTKTENARIVIATNPGLKVPILRVRLVEYGQKEIKNAKK